ncbi:MAG: molybdopterin-dependent oxidoreductase [Bacteroidetes bacterium]|nr:molybdopterin-dependent oxidoreductase [Bacteroidota bacterium]
MEIIQLTVNDIQRVYEGPKDTVLLTYLREHLGLMGSKNGCGAGHCGACMIIVDGKAKRACLVRMKQLQGSDVETIENLSKQGTLHPLQAAFVNHGAVQCGFCTPGMIMSAKALLDNNLNPGDDDIRKALKFNICRCTGYVTIAAAIRDAAKVLREGKTLKIQNEWNGIGTPTIRQEAIDKVKGKPLYTEDFPVKGALHGELLLSRFAHAEVVSIKTDKAVALSGVAAVLTAKDIPGSNAVGIITKKQPVLAQEKVRYLGDAVALVIAETPDIAQEALNYIEVTYRELPVVMNMLTAAEDAVHIHQEGNVLSKLHIQRGDINEGFRLSDVIVEEEITVPMIEHSYLEPDAVYAVPEEDDVITVYTQSQSSFSYREEIAENLSLPLDRIRVVTRTTGGAFGGREEPTIQVHAALGALVTGKPVHMVMTRKDVLLRTSKRHGEILQYKIGASSDGRIQAFQANIIADTGAYPSAGEAVILRSVLFAPGPYKIPNADIQGIAVYTNRTPAGAMRGFGSNQPAVASEIMMDMLAEKLNMDPIELRMINGLEPGAHTVGGQVLDSSVGLKESLEAVREKLADELIPSSSGSRRIGIGIASAMKNVGLGSGMDDSAGAIAELTHEGIVIKVSSVDSGQGSDTVVRSIAAEVLNIHPGSIKLITNDTALTLDCGVTTASRQTFVTGNAVKYAAAGLKNQILGIAAKEHGTPVEKLEIRESNILESQTGTVLNTLHEIFMKSGVLSETNTYTAPVTVPVSEITDNINRDDESFRLHFSYCYGTQAAIVAVDTDSGKVEVLKVIAAHDAGKAVNPAGARGQIEGGIMMGIGYALTEEFLMDETALITNTFKKTGVPGIDMMPEIDSLLIENQHPLGPFGAKGMGELPMLPTTPAVINAIYHAIGVRVTHLPAKPDTLTALLKQQKNEAGGR